MKNRRLITYQEVLHNNTQTTKPIKKLETPPKTQALFSKMYLPINKIDKPITDKPIINKPILNK